jgi:hypothetical protein
LLVVAGLLVGGVRVVVLKDDAFFLGVEALEGAVLLPELGGGWELVEGERLLDVALGACLQKGSGSRPQDGVPLAGWKGFTFLEGLVVEDEAVAIGGEDERDSEGG